MKKLLYSLFCLVLAISFVSNTGIFAATTGKIQGTITSSETQEPLPGVNIVIEGTTLGAASDENGFYFVLNVPPGTYSLKASMVGYRVETQSDVRVYVDRYTPVNFRLQTSAVAGEEVTITAERAPVPLDVSSTEAYISGDEAAASAVSRFDELIGYQAGIEFDNSSRDDQKGFEVRGGEVDETDVQLDGMSLMNRMTRQPAIPLSRNLIQDVQILTGGFNAEYGNVRSGLINVITKDGSYNRYSGVFEGRYRAKGAKHFGMDPYKLDGTTPHGNSLFGNDSFTGVKSSMVYDYENTHTDIAAERKDLYDRSWQGWDKYAAALPSNVALPGGGTINGKRSPQFCQDYEAFVLRYPTEWYNNEPDINLDFGVGGPIPGLPSTKFYASSYWNRSKFVMMTSLAHSNEFNETLKISHRIGSNMNLVATALVTYVQGIGPGYRDRSDGWGLSPNVMTGDNRAGLLGVQYSSITFQQAAYNPIDNRTYSGNLKFTHTYNPSTYYELSLGTQVYDSDKNPMRHRDDKTIIHYINDSLTGQQWGFAEYPRAYGYEGLDIYNTPGGRNDPTGWFEMASYPQGRGRQDNQSTEINFQGNIVSQINKSNQIKAGFYYAWHHLNERTEWDNVAEFSIVTEKPFNWNKYKANMSQFDWYFQDKLEWEGMIVNAGLRGTSFFPGANGFNVTDANMFDGTWQGARTWGTVEYEGNWQFANLRTRKVKTRILLQPRLGISHPITESSKIYFNYGHFYNPPGTNEMFMVRSSRSMGGPWGTGFISEPDILWPKLVQYEIGYSQSIYNQLLLQISGYYKDYTNEMMEMRMTGYYSAVDIGTFANNVYRDIRGLEFRLERSFGRFINGWANYNYMITSSGETDIDTIHEDPLRMRDEWADAEQSRPQILPSFRMSFSLRTPVGWGPGSPILGIKPLSEWRTSIMYTWRDGGETLDNSSDPPRDWRYIDRVDVQMMNLYITKRLARGASFYINATNLFNWKRYRGSTSGDYKESLHLWYETEEQKGNDKIGEWDKPYIYTDYWTNYIFYPNNRMIYYGIRYQF